MFVVLVRCHLSTPVLCCGLYLQRRFISSDSYYSEEEWVQLEEAASCAKVVKVEVDVWDSDRSSCVLAAGFRKNEVLREVTLSRVPEELVDSVKRTLSMNTALTTVVVEATLM